MCAMEWACHLLARARSVPTKVCYQLWMGTVHGGNNGVLTFPKVLKCQNSKFGMHGQSLGLKVAVDSWKHALIWDMMGLYLGRYS